MSFNIMKFVLHFWGNWESPYLSHFFTFSKSLFGKNPKNQVPILLFSGKTPKTQPAFWEKRKEKKDAKEKF